MTERIFLIPNNCVDESSSLSILSLQHPRTSLPTRYILNSTNREILEITAITGKNPHIKNSKLEAQNAARSLLLVKEKLRVDDRGSANGSDTSDTRTFEDGRLFPSSTIYTCTSISILFLALPVLWRTRSKYLKLDDIHDLLLEDSPDFEYVAVRTLFPLRSVCDSLNMGQSQSEVAQDATKVEDENIHDNDFYRLNVSKLFSHLDALVARVSNSLPQSIIVKKVLDPLVSPEMLPTPEDMVSLAKQRTSIQMLSSYLLPEICAQYSATKEFKPLVDHLSSLAKKRTDILAVQNAMNDSMNNKRKGVNTTGPIMKKKPLVGKGAKSKVKTNVSGNSKLSSFFKPVAKKNI
ncbi:hypothetical protein NADFUDRAFT_53246 [Nadsonia fulvescens var. elongata DSM 6958]|uniref:Ribonuclease H2 subunit B n=1 Tax=Nadsonia fulvescens var. elongata DSM 6958 TaxID=857566 RepID=A0A1E3PDU0_9ASCO|nr:hypothetical protein NADFUDRAFT_53246 [Nadsonia fulvescens var. elongata DSM 6958]